MPGEAPRDPEELEAATAPASGEISALTTMGAVHLTVSELERSVAYYRQTIGLDVLDRGGRRCPARCRCTRAAGARGGSGSTAGLRLHGPLPLRAPRARAPRPRTLARACSARPCSARRPLRPLRQRGDLPERPGRARDRDLLRSPARGLGRTGGGEDDDAPSGHRRPPVRARRSGDGAVRRSARGDGDGPRAPEGGLDRRRR